MYVIIVLGMKVYNNLGDELRCRLDKAANLYKILGNAIIVVSGGKTNPDMLRPESSFMSEYLAKLSIPNERIIEENRSMDTIENAYFSRLIIDKMDNVDVIFVVTSCYHENRSEFIFNFIFDGKYPINFNNCCKLEENTKSEKLKMKYAESFFSNIKRGDMNAITEKLRNVKRNFQNSY